MPFVKEHACRLRNPDEFVRFFRKSVHDDKDIGDHKATHKVYDIIIGYRDDESSDVQASRYSIETWTAEEAKAHCTAMKGIEFAPAQDSNHISSMEDSMTFPNQTNQIERRNFSMTEIRAIVGEDGKPGEILGTAAVYNQKSELIWGFNEIIEPGFFENVLNDDVRALWNHNSDVVLGRVKSGTLFINDESDGLKIKIIPPETNAGKDALISIGRGDVDQMSFGFSVKMNGDEWIQEGNSIIRKLKKGGCERLYDVSPVAFPAYPQTSASVRSAFEAFNSNQPENLPGQEPEEVPNDGPEAQERLENLRRRLEIVEKS